MIEYCIELNHITKKFNRFTAVDDVNLKLLPGKIYGFVGPNGAGKSTTMSMIMGTLVPTSGDGCVMGHPLGSKESLKILGYSPEFTSFYLDMSCLEYLWYMGTLSGLSKKDAMNRAIELIKQFNLEESASKKVAKFSTGMKKKVSLAQAMIHNPKILLLDEPTANLDPKSRMDILDIVKKMVHEYHLTVLISSHVLAELQTVIDHVVMIDHGKIIMDQEIGEAQSDAEEKKLLVNTSNNEELIHKLSSKYSFEDVEGKIRFKTADIKNLKDDVVRICYEEKISLDLLQEELASLDLLYKQALKEEENETHSN